MSRYHSFKELSLEKRLGVDYAIQVVDRGSPLAVIAPHGGGIEPGTAEIAVTLAGLEYSCYVFDGLRENDNRELHLTSTHFDEPQCLSLIQRACVVIAIHGYAGKDEVVYIGGRHAQLKHHLQQGLERAGFVARLDGSRHAGNSLSNICNKGLLGRGIQLEITSGLRRQMFKGFSRAARTETTPLFAEFISAIQATIHEAINWQPQERGYSIHSQ